MAIGYTNSSRFQLDVVTWDGTPVCSLPYRDMQGEWKLNADSANLRFTVPYKDNLWLTPDKLVPGKHLIMLTDYAMGTTGNNLRFGGPLWDLTASSSEGTLSCNASSIFTLFKRRLVKTTSVFSAQKPEAIMSTLVTNANSAKRIYDATFSASIMQASATALTKYTVTGTDTPFVADLLDELSNMGNGVDYYIYWGGTVSSAAPTLRLYGGRISPASNAGILEYGAMPVKGSLPKLAGYALTMRGSEIVNEADVVGKPGVVTTVPNATSQTTYGQLYQDSHSDDQLATTAEVTAYGNMMIRNAQPTVIPQISVKGIDPLIDFTYGDKYQLIIDDGWATYNDVVRVVGWQSTFGRQDQMTNVLYLNDLSEVA